MISAGFSTETGPAGPGCFCLFQLRLPEKSWDSTNLIRKSGVSPPKKVVVVDGWIMDRIQAPAHGCPTSSPTAPCIGWQCKAIGSTNLPNLPCYTMLMGGINIYKLSLKYALWHWEYHHYLSLPPKSPKPWGFYHHVPHDVPYIGYMLVPTNTAQPAKSPTAQALAGVPVHHHPVSPGFLTEEVQGSVGAYWWFTKNGNI